LGAIPGLKHLASSTSSSEERDELLIVITPHIVNLEPTESTEVWLSK
jgi:type II secretory pathway component HofQ